MSSYHLVILLEPVEHCFNYFLLVFQNVFIRWAFKVFIIAIFIYMAPLGIKGH